MKRKCLILSFVLLGAALAACTTRGHVPPQPDYADTAMWYAGERGGEADVFYIASTEVADYEVAGALMHYADVTRDSLRALLLAEMQGVDHLLAGKLNFYSPYYRQCTLETFAADSLLAARKQLAMTDVKRAFDYYIEHLNGGRPFVLAGFSQGAMAVVELLKTIDDEAYSRMAAAYVIGWKVTRADLAPKAARVHIVPARDSADLGVTICYNSVREPHCAIPMISGGNTMAINPLNWRTDCTPAVFEHNGDTLRAALDTVSLLLVVEGYSRQDYMLPLIGREGNYHTREISLYSAALRRNMALRARAMALRQSR